ncbi:MAG: flagellar assembly protein T N-terminal domain-containing protein [Idiomarina sp.]|nr:flagellar assembly protein T N-terminal domain-containing protein [Idiomarina sp.]
MWRIWMLLGFFLIPVSALASGDWYETRGWAPVINGDVERARARAIENALRQGLDLAGGSVHSVEEVVDGVLTGQRMQWRTTGAIEHAELVRERTSGQRHEVTLRTLIRPNVSSCAGADFKPSVVIAPFEVKYREHTTTGDIHKIDEASAFRFSRLVGQHSRNLFVQHLLTGPQGFERLVRANDSSQISQFARRVAHEHNGQFVVAGIFHDLSAEPRYRNNVLFWRHPPLDRQFELSLYLMDGYSGDLLTTASVREHARWDFRFNENVDVNSERFWRSEFGLQLQERMRDLVYGLDERLQCQQLKGSVVRADGQSIHINIGERNRLEAGARLQVLHRGGFFDAMGHYREQWVVNPVELEVQDVFATTAVARPMQGELLNGVQERDVVIVL